MPVSSDQRWAAPGGLLYLLQKYNFCHLYLFIPLLYLYHTTLHPPWLLHLLQNATLQCNDKMQWKMRKIKYVKDIKGSVSPIQHRGGLFSLLQLRKNLVREIHCKPWKQWMNILQCILSVTDLSSGPGSLLLLSPCWRCKSSPTIPHVNIIMEL